MGSQWWKTESGEVAFRMPGRCRRAVRGAECTPAGDRAGIGYGGGLEYADAASYAKPSWIGKLPNVEPIRLSNLVGARKSGIACSHLGTDSAGDKDASVEDI